jgi:hypothetical protein
MPGCLSFPISLVVILAWQQRDVNSQFAISINELMFFAMINGALCLQAKNCWL